MSERAAVGYRDYSPYLKGRVRRKANTNFMVPRYFDSWFLRLMVNNKSRKHSGMGPPCWWCYGTDGPWMWLNFGVQEGRGCLYRYYRVFNKPWSRHAEIVFEEVCIKRLLDILLTRLQLVDHEPDTEVAEAFISPSTSSNRRQNKKLVPRGTATGVGHCNCAHPHPFAPTNPSILI